MSTSVAHAVAGESAPALTEETREAFAAGRSVYGERRPQGASGQPLTLVRSGEIKRAIEYAATGTIVRAILGPVNKRGVQYGRFLIGRYGVLPNGDLPTSYTERLEEIVKRVGPAAAGVRRKP